MVLLLPVFKTAPVTQCEDAGELRDAGRARRKRQNANKREEGMSNLKEEEDPPKVLIHFSIFNLMLVKRAA